MIWLTYQALDVNKAFKTSYISKSSLADLVDTKTTNNNRGKTNFREWKQIIRKSLFSQLCFEWT